eukprot:765061-Hanusia_phi.AAC.2
MVVEGLVLHTGTCPIQQWWEETYSLLDSANLLALAPSFGPKCLIRTQGSFGSSQIASEHFLVKSGETPGDNT